MMASAECVELKTSTGPLVVRSLLENGPTNAADHFRKFWPMTYTYRKYPTKWENLYRKTNARNNPHGKRVRHIMAMNMPICAVFDYSQPINVPKSSNGSTKSTCNIEHTKTKPPATQPNMFPKIPTNAFENKSAVVANIRETLKKVQAPKIERLPTAAPWRQELHALATLLGLVDLTGKDQSEGVNSSRQPIPRQAELSRPKTTAGDGRLRSADHRLYDIIERPSTASLNLIDRQRLQTPVDQRPRTAYYSAETGRLVPPPSRAMCRSSRGGTRGSHRPSTAENISDADMECLVLQILCQILNVDDVKIAQTWLCNASDADKSTILEMIRTALLSHVTSDPKEGPETQDQRGDCFERISTATEKDSEPVKVEIISHKSNKHQTESHVLQTGSDGKKTVIDRLIFEPDHQSSKAKTFKTDLKTVEEDIEEPDMNEKRFRETNTISNPIKLKYVTRPISRGD